MRPYTLTDAEADLIAALEAGVTGPELAQMAAQVDRLDPNWPTPVEPVALLSAALWYAQAGLSVFPLQPGAKVPHSGFPWRDEASPDPEVITAWWERWPESNVAIATGGLVDVIDIDGFDGIVSYCGLEEVPAAYGQVSTPRPGGHHLYVLADPSRGNRAAMFPAVDYRGAGGYVAAPPSVITVGPHPGRYRWLRPLDFSTPIDEGIAS